MGCFFPLQLKRSSAQLYPGRPPERKAGRCFHFKSHVFALSAFQKICSWTFLVAVVRLLDKSSEPAPEQEQIRERSFSFFHP